MGGEFGLRVSHLGVRPPEDEGFTFVEIGFKGGGLRRLSVDLNFGQKAEGVDPGAVGGGDGSGANFEIHGAVKSVAFLGEELRGFDGDPIGAGVLDFDFAGPGAAAHDVRAAGDEPEGIAVHRGGGKAEDEVVRACGPLFGFRLRFRGREYLVGDAGGDLGVGIEMARGKDEAFAEVVEAVELSIAGEADGKFELGQVAERTDRVLKLGLIQPTRQGAADGDVLEQVGIEEGEHGFLFSGGGALFFRWRHQALVDGVKGAQPDINVVDVGPVDVVELEIDVAFFGVGVVALEAVFREHRLHGRRDRRGLFRCGREGEQAGEK